MLCAPQAQEIAARNWYRPRVPSSFARHGSGFRTLELFTIDVGAPRAGGGFGGNAQKTQFADGGFIDQILHRKR